jgi:hypothetical protein
VIACRFRSRAELELEVIALRHQLVHARDATAAKQKTPAFSPLSEFSAGTGALHATFPFRATGSPLACIDFMRAADDAPSSDNP